MLGTFDQVFAQAYAIAMGAKLGFSEPRAGDEQLINTLLLWMEQYEADFTDTFRDLTIGEVHKLPFFKIPEFEPWYTQVSRRQEESFSSLNQVKEAMQAVNPAYIPRNHLVEEALFYGAEKHSMDHFHELLQLLLNPFAYTKEQLAYKPPAAGYNKNYKTYCGT